MRQFSDRATVYVGDDARPPTIAFPLVDSEPGAAAGLSELIWFGHEPHKAGVKVSATTRSATSAPSGGMREGRFLSRKSPRNPPA